MGDSNEPALFRPHWTPTQGHARVQSTFLGGFLADERLRRLVAEGLLEFVLWDGTTECTDHLKCFQPVMYSHAVLAFWGANVYLSMADHDEYLALPNPERATSVQDLIGRCFDGQSQARPRFRRPSDRVRAARVRHAGGD